MKNSTAPTKRGTSQSRQQINHGDEHRDTAQGIDHGEHEVRMIRDDVPDPQHIVEMGPARTRLHAYQYKQPRTAGELGAEAEAIYSELRSARAPEDVMEAADTLAQAAADFATLLIPGDERSILTARTTQAALDGPLRGLLWNAVSGHRWMQRREYDFLCARTEQDENETRGRYAAQVTEFESVLHAILALEAHLGPLRKDVLKDTVLRVEAFELGKTQAGAVQEGKKRGREAEAREIRAALRRV